MHEAGDLELDVVGTGRSQPRRALQAVVEDREAAFVVGVGRRPQRVEQRVDVGERPGHEPALTVTGPAPVTARIASATRVSVGP